VPTLLSLYRSSASAREEMASATPEQAETGMQAWTAWAEKAGPALVDLGAPPAGQTDIAGFSLLETDTRAAVADLLADHPHRHVRGASIEVLEFLAPPGMG